jgi:DNA segregation ATPase FtsK/SpoIIIE-like protein
MMNKKLDYKTVLALVLPYRWLADGEEKARRALSKKLSGEADYFASVIRERLTRLNICYRYPKSKDDFLQSKVQQVGFVKAVGTPEAIYLMVDTRKLPRGVKVADLSDDDVLDDLSVACRRPVRFRWRTECGAWYIIERESGAWGVPRKVDFKDVMEYWPEDSRKPILVPMGSGENRKMIYRSLAEFPHALIGGATGAGKTTFQHAWICALIKENAPDRLKLALVDLKGGVEFTRYKELPHLLNVEGVSPLVKTADGVLDLLAYIRDEMDERLVKFEEAGGIQNIRIWNYRHRKNRMARIVLFVDEMAVIMLDRKLRSKAETLLADITARGRAPGIHVVLATQRPEVKVVSGLIKGNMDARIAFRVTDNSSSVIILDDTSAAKMDETTPPGRFIYKRGLERIEIQGPMITDGQIRQIVDDVVSGRAESESVAVPPEDIFRASVQQLEGSFSRRMLYEIFRGEVSQAYLERLGQEYEGSLIEIDGETYEMLPSSGPKPRRLKLAGGDVSENAHATRHTPQEQEIEVEDVDGEIVE